MGPRRVGHDGLSVRVRGAPAFTFGLLADIQYVDVDDKPNFTGTQWRQYRNALVVAGDAV